VSQPRVTATKPDGPIAKQSQWNQEASWSRPRQRSQSESTPTPIIAKPIPTIPRKLQNSTGAFGHWSRGKSFRPFSSASSEWPRIRLPSFGMPIAYLVRSSSRSGRPKM
jgi:hypothetical protein